jgi:hypothetical protein
MPDLEVVALDIATPQLRAAGAADTYTFPRPARFQKGTIPRVSSTNAVVSPLAWNSDNFDVYEIIAQNAALTINADSGSPLNGQKILFRIKDNGTARVLTWTTGASKAFREMGVVLPTTTVQNKILYVGAIYNSTDARWDAIAVGQEI